MTIGGVFLYRCQDHDLSGDVAISGVICHETWGLLRVARNDKLDIPPNDMYFTLGSLEHRLEALLEWMLQFGGVFYTE